jgi:hypothetical protein
MISTRIQEGEMRLLVLGSICAGLAAAASNSPATFNRDVLPVLQKSCQTCHRPGEIAPMSLMSYQEARPWAKAIKTAVLSKKMPPWSADPKFGHFLNDPRLSDAEIKALAAWADNGAPEGNAKDKPKPADFMTGWNMKPDVVLEMPKPFEVPASGIVEYQYILVPTHFEKDTWVTAAEVRPGNRAVMHHVIMYVRPPGSEWLKELKPGEPYVPVQWERDANGAAVKRIFPPGYQPPPPGQPPRNTMAGVELLTAYVPGLRVQQFDSVVPDTAKLIPAGADLIFQLHYTTNGKAATDQTKVGLKVASAPPKHRLLTSDATQRDFEIPANDANYETHSMVTVNVPAQLVWLLPHMHVRGKDFLYQAVYPTGETETLLNVPKYDFNWQLGYEEAKAISLPKGTQIQCTAHHDNSANNAANPNPNATVRWGDQTWEEMMMGFFGVVVDANVNPADVIVRPRPVRRPAL